jgi:hypothetical protein
VRAVERANTLEVEIRAPGGNADLHVTADLSSRPNDPPEGSPFADLREARRYAGPLPYTFDYESETGYIVLVRGVRSAWDPQPVSVEVRELAFLRQSLFRDHEPVLANAFYVADVDYRWERGTIVAPGERLAETPSTRAA